LCHPLIDEAVPNSIALAPPHGVLVTGSNMSGKSTLLRTVGVNVVLAQTINTCLARAYQAPVYQVRSCIGRADDLLAGKSYYWSKSNRSSRWCGRANVASRICSSSTSSFAHERRREIAAAEAVLGVLIEGRKPHVHWSLRTTVSWLICSATVTSSVTRGRRGPDGLVFDYHLNTGSATSRNAIALLKLNGAPQAVVNPALARAEVLDRQRERRRTASNS